MKLASSVAALSATCAYSQQAGTQTAERHPALKIQQCRKSGGCVDEQKSVVIDSNWRWTHTVGTTTNCYKGNTWDASICPDGKTCASNCALEGADQEYENTYGVKASGSELKLNFVTQGPYSKNVGSRSFLLESETKYKMFKLKNKEFTFDVDVSQLPCGLNGALYFVAMDEDGGMSRFPSNKAGAKYGTGYCDAQCPHDIKFIGGEANCEDWKPSSTDVNAGVGKYGTCCTEFDVWEANSIGMAYTAHACEVTEQTRCEGKDCGDNDSGDRFNGICDKNGCDFQTYRLGKEDFWGPGSNFEIDTTQPMTSVTQFITDDNTDTGKLVEVRRFYIQNGKTINTPSLKVGDAGTHDSLSVDFCSAWADFTQDGTNFLEKGGFDNTDAAFEKGMVLALSMWDDHDVNMLWLDSTYPVDTPDAPGAKRGTCDTSSGDPKDVESAHADASVRYFNIRYGEIGSTTNSGPSPGPTPTPTPSPSPSPIPSGGCCSWAKPDQVQECGDSTAYCMANADNCVQCDGHWIHPGPPSPSPPAPTPTPPAPTPSPSPSGCPGGTLEACIDLCPPDIFAACAESCSKRCPHAVV